MATTYYKELILKHDADDEVSLHIEIDCEIVTHPTSASGQFGPPEHYDPGSDAEWEFTEARFVLAGQTDIKLNFLQLEAILGRNITDMLWEQAQEYASERYDPTDYMPEEP